MRGRRWPTGFLIAGLACGGADPEPPCGDMYGHFSPDAIDCTQEDDPELCLAVARDLAEPWIYRYHGTTVDGIEGEILVGTADPAEFSGYRFAYAHGDDLSEDYELDVCHDVFFDKGPGGLAASCVDVRQVCPELEE